MPALHEGKIIAGLILTSFPLVIVVYSALYTLNSCPTCAQISQLRLLYPLDHPFSTVLFCSLVAGISLFVLQSKPKIRLPLPRTKLFIAGAGFLSVGTIFLGWGLAYYLSYLDYLKHPYHLCDVCDPTRGYGTWVLAGTFFSLVAVVLLTMEHKRKVLHAHGYI